MLTHGFQIISFDETRKLRPISLDSAVFESRDRCVACSAYLMPLAVLVGNEGGSRMRVGMCPACGYVGYMDFPNERWLTDFYAGQWDNARVPFTELTASHQRALSLISGDEATHRRESVLEIGCGYGAALRYFVSRGFSRVVGTDPSPHRMEYARATSGVECIQGVFGDRATWGALYAHAPYDVIFSHHVIEHTYDPESFIANAARLQVNGGRLILALPNVVGEHSGYLLLYLPHPHSFSKQAIERLLNRYGYAITEDASPHALNMVILAVKTKAPQPRYVERHDYSIAMHAKVSAGLALLDLPRFGASASWHWDAHDKGVGGDDAWMTKRPRIRYPACMRAILRRVRAAPNYSFSVAPLARRYEPFIPYEIQYTGPIRLLIK